MIIKIYNRLSRRSTPMINSCISVHSKKFALIKQIFQCTLRKKSGKKCYFQNQTEHLLIISMHVHTNTVLIYTYTVYICEQKP